MTSRERLLKAIDGKQADRLPVTTHHLMTSFLNKYMGGKSKQEFFDYFGFDSVHWIASDIYNESEGEFYDPTHQDVNPLEARRICSDNWRISIEELDDSDYKTKRFNIITPEKTLSMVLQSNEHTTWIIEYLIKEKSDIEIIAKYMTKPKCDVETVNKIVNQFKNVGLIRGHIYCFDGFGQPGCWQDFACLFGIENLIMAVFEDPEWVHTFLKVLQYRKKGYIQSLKGANYDILEFGGGDASSTVISPDIFQNFVAPYDAELIECAHQAGQKIVYHTCGGMMPILEDIAAMNPNAIETFTPPAMAGDANLAEAKKRLNNKVCMIGGFDQVNFFKNCSTKDTRNEVRRCFEEAGEGGGYILSPSDHFFEADLDLINAFVDEAKKCVY